MVVDLPAVLVVVDSSRSVYRGGVCSEEPVGAGGEMACQLGHHSTRIDVVHAPVIEVLPVGIAPGTRIEAREGRGLVSAPGFISVGEHAHEVDVAEPPGSEEALLHGL